MHDGILLIDKQAGWSSFDVVAKTRSILRTEIGNLDLENSSHPISDLPSPRKIKVGHTGTLDPLATGLMIVVVGSYCKRASEFSKLDKIYEVQMKLGATSSTGDEEGLKTDVKSLKVKEEAIKEVFQGFMGESMQIPPIYSAIKIGGKRAYSLARAGKEVKLDPRSITIYDIKITSYAYPFIDFTVHVTSGTYIRSLVEDIGKKLTTGAYMSNLKRTKVGSFVIEDAIQVEDVSFSSLQELPE